MNVIISGWLSSYELTPGAMDIAMTLTAKLYTGSTTEWWNTQGTGHFTISSAENQKGINAVHWCSIENQKDALTIDFVR